MTGRARAGSWALGGLLLAASLLALLAGVALVTRPLLPIDETRYVGVAWEMWQGDHWLVPHLNGVPYSHKGPVTFWLLQLGWWLFGVSDGWARMVSPLCAAAGLAFTTVLARRLWPERPRVAALAPMLLIACGVFAIYSTMLVTDLPLTMLALSSLVFLARAWRAGGVAPWVGFGIAIGLGVITKGPVALLHALPAALSAPLWVGEARPPSWGRWYGAVGLATLLALALALAWALPAAHAGGAAYGEAILWHQTAGRVVQSFAHAQPWWFYLPVVPVLLLPLPLWPRLWRAVAAGRSESLDSGTRFCLAWIAFALVGFSAISGKQIHYLLPLIAGFALLAARALDGAAETADGGDHVVIALPLLVGGAALLLVPLVPLTARLLGARREVLELLWSVRWWLGIPTFLAGLWVWRRRGRSLERAVAELALSVVAVLALGHYTVLGALRPAYDLESLGRRLGDAARAGRPLAHVGRYDGQFQFAARLDRPVAELQPREVEAWFESNPNGLLVSYWREGAEAAGDAPETTQLFRGKTLGLWDRDGFRAAARTNSPAVRELVGGTGG